MKREQVELDTRPDPLRRAPAGETRSLMDSEGNKYQVKAAVLDAGDLLASHNEQTFQADPRFPEAFQARIREGVQSQQQVKDIGQKLDPDRLGIDNLDATAGAPVVYVIDGNPVVLAGNGRVMGLRRAMTENPEGWAAYTAKVKADAEKLGIDVEGIENPVLVRELVSGNRGQTQKEGQSPVSGDPRSRPGMTPFEEAIRLAANSQKSTSAGMSRMEEAVSFARAAGIKEGPEGAVPINPERLLNTDGLTEANIVEFLAENRPLQELLNSHLDAAGRNDPTTLVQTAKHVMAASLPESLRALATTPDVLGDMLYETAPYLAHLSNQVKRGRMHTDYDLLPHLDAAVRLYMAYRKSGLSTRRILDDIDLRARNVSIAGTDPIYDKVSPESVGLAVGMLNATKLRNPVGTMRDKLTAWVKAAREHDPGQVELFERPTTSDLVKQVFKIDTSLYEGARTENLVDGQNAAAGVKHPSEVEKVGSEKSEKGSVRHEKAPIEVERELLHYTLPENVASIVKSGFDTKRPPIFGTGGIGEENPSGKFIEGDVVYLTRDRNRWSKTEEGKDLQAVQVELDSKAKVLKIDSMDSYNKAHQELFPNEKIYYRLRLPELIRRAGAEGYDAVEIARGSGWELPDRRPNKYGESDWYDDMSGYSGEQDVFVMNTNVIRSIRPENESTGYDIGQVFRVQEREAQDLFGGDKPVFREMKLVEMTGERAVLEDPYGDRLEVYPDELGKYERVERDLLKPDSKQSGHADRKNDTLFDTIDDENIVEFGAGITPRQAMERLAPRMYETFEEIRDQMNAIRERGGELHNPGHLADPVSEYLGRMEERFGVEMKPGIAAELTGQLKHLTADILTMKQRVELDAKERFDRLALKPISRAIPDVHKKGRETLFEVAHLLARITDDGRFEFTDKVRSGTSRLQVEKETDEIMLFTDDGPVPYSELRGSIASFNGKERLVGDEIVQEYIRALTVPLLKNAKPGDLVTFKGDQWTVSSIGPNEMTLEQVERVPTGEVHLYRMTNLEELQDKLDWLLSDYPEAENILKMFKAEEEARVQLPTIGSDLPAFAHKVLAEQFGVNEMMDTDGAWVPELKQVERGLGDAVGNLSRSIRSRRRNPSAILSSAGLEARVKDAFRPYRSSHRKLKRGWLDWSGAQEKDLALATTEARISLYAEERASEFAGRALELIAEPYDGHNLLPGYRAVHTGFLSPDGFREARALANAPGLLIRLGVDPAGFTQATYAARGAMFQVPSKIYEEFSRFFGVKPAESTSEMNVTLTDAIGQLTRSMLAIRTKAQLTRPSTTIRNFISQGMLLTSGILRDFNRAVYRSLFSSVDAPLAELKGLAWASLRQFTKEARTRYPDPLLGAHFIDQFTRGRGTDIEDLLLLGFHYGDTQPKRFLFMKQHYADAYRRAVQMQKRGEIPAGKEALQASVQQMMEESIPVDWFKSATDEIMWHGPDYRDAPKALKWWSQQAWSRGVIPYPNWIYHITRTVLGKYGLGAVKGAVYDVPVDAMRAWKLHNKIHDSRTARVEYAKTMEDLADRLADVFTGSTMWSLAWWLTGPMDEDEELSRSLTESGARLPYEIDTSGRMLVYKDDAKEWWARVRDQPWIGEATLARELLGGRADIEDVFGERLSLGMFANLVAAAFGYRTKYNKDQSFYSILGQEVGSSVKLAPWFKFARRMQDTQKRRTKSDAHGPEGWITDFAFGFADQFPFLSEFVPERNGQYVRSAELAKQFGLNVRVINRPDKVEAIKEAERKLKWNRTWQSEGN